MNSNTSPEPLPSASWYEVHSCCPKCGSIEIERTCIGCVEVPGKPFFDDANTATCLNKKCKWRGKVSECKPKRRRSWIYLHQPADYDIPGHSCRSKKYTWSEFQKHLWCYKCEVDFIPKDNGVFDGPIAVTIAGMMGYDFRRINLKTKKIMKEKV